MQNQQNHQSEIVCNINAIKSDLRDTHAKLAGEIFDAVLEIRELPSGYGFRLPLEALSLLKVTSWMVNERLCCPFFTFTLKVNEQCWLELTGTPEVKSFINSAIVTPLHETGKLPDIETWIADQTSRIEGNSHQHMD